MQKLPFFQRPFSFKYYNATIALVIINVLVFIVGYASPSLLNRMALIPATIIVSHWYWEPLTYMFVHANVGHIFFNMISLLIFGVQLERKIGSSEFLLFYLLSGVLAGLLSFAVYVATGTYNVALVGASGAIFAISLGFATYYPTARLFIWGILPVRAPVLVLGYAAIELFLTFAQTGGNVAHMTHLFGLGVGYLYLVARLRIDPIRVFRNSSRY